MRCMSAPEVRAAVAEWLADLDSPVDHAQLESRFWAMTTLDGWNGEGDVLWGGSITDKGYAMFSIKGVQVYAHRVAVRIGLPGWGFGCQPRAVPRRMTVDHVRARGCMSRSCVSPLHLEVVTRSVNGGRVRDMTVFT